MSVPKKSYDRPAAGPNVMDYEAAYARLAGDGGRGGSRSRPDDLGFDDIYQAHDGLGPDDLDIEVEFEDDPEWRDDWTPEDKRGVALIVVLIVVAIVCYRLGELSAIGWFS